MYSYIAMQILPNLKSIEIVTACMIISLEAWNSRSWVSTLRQICGSDDIRKTAKQRIMRGLCEPL